MQTIPLQTGAISCIEPRILAKIVEPPVGTLELSIRGVGRPQSDAFFLVGPTVTVIC
jgi:hypothetical protein